MKLFDVHIHLNDYKDKPLTNVIEEAKKAGADRFICVSKDEADWVQTAKMPVGIVKAFGMHPWYLNEARLGWEMRLEDMLLEHPDALVGEVGLDGSKEIDEEKQMDAFLAQMELAKKYNRPMIVHAVKAQSWFEEIWADLPKKILFHSYSGKMEFLNRLIAKRAYVSLSKSVLKNPLADEIIAAIPDDRILLETDAPFQGDFSDMANVADKVIEVKGKKIIEKIYRNSEEFVKVYG